MADTDLNILILRQRDKLYHACIHAFRLAGSVKTADDASRDKIQQLDAVMAEVINYVERGY